MIKTKWWTSGDKALRIIGWEVHQDTKKFVQGLISAAAHIEEINLEDTGTKDTVE